jgi:hypothetical protein
MNLELPEYLAILLVAFCFVTFSLMIVRGLFEKIEELKRK